MARKRTPKWLQSSRLRSAAAVPAEKPDWLSRALSRAGVLTKEDAEEAIRAGRVKLNGRVVTQPLAPYSARDTVTLDGRKLGLQAATRALMFHKPAGAVSSKLDDLGHPTVFDMLTAQLPEGLRTYGWHAIGRLDRDTTGLLLFTNDERLVTFATSPATHLPKRYLARVSGRLEEAKLEPLRRGMVLDDGPTRPATARIRGSGEVELTLTEGRNHQVKRMLGAVGLPVLALHREAVGALTLDVPPGQLRELSAAEITRGIGFGSSSS